MIKVKIVKVETRFCRTVLMSNVNCRLMSTLFWWGTKVETQLELNVDTFFGRALRSKHKLEVNVDRN